VLHVRTTARAEEARRGLCYTAGQGKALITSSKIDKHVVSQSSATMQARKHITGDLLKAAATVNIEIRAIDPSKPVAEQGSFDLILQNCRDAGERHCVVGLFISAACNACAITFGLCIALPSGLDRQCFDAC